MPTLFDYNHLAQVILLWEMRKFICYCKVFALFYFEIEGHFQAQAPEAYIWRDDLTEGFLCYAFGGLIFGGAYSRNFTVLYRPLFNYYNSVFFTYEFDWLLKNGIRHL